MKQSGNPWLTKALLLALLAAPLPLQGADYLLSADDDDVVEILTVFDLTFVREIGDEVYLVTDLLNRDPQLLLESFGAATGDDDDDDDGEGDDGEDDGDYDWDEEAVLELAGSVQLPETGQNDDLLAGIGGELVEIDLENYWGSVVWEAFIEQDLSALDSLARIQEAHGITIGAGVVAVIDTGVDPSHVGLAGGSGGDVIVPGFDFVTRSAGIPSELDAIPADLVAQIKPSTTTILDRYIGGRLFANGTTTVYFDTATSGAVDPTQFPEAFGHGTMVAGLVRLVAPGARIMPLRVFGPDGTATLDQIVEAIYYAVDNGAKVINMSFGLSPSAIASVALQTAIEHAWSENVICVAAAGNSGQATVMAPASMAYVVGVAATDEHDQRAPFSNFGNEIALAAPGRALVSLYPGDNYALGAGTSYSTAVVSGAAALLAGLDPGVAPAEARQTLTATAEPLGDPALGAGRIDVLALLEHFVGQ